jgi:DUF4097 and DUF4098 domain-containing protein YvlB
VDSITAGSVTMTTVNGNVQGTVAFNSSYNSASDPCLLQVSSVNGNLDVDATFSCTTRKVSMGTINGNVDSSVVGYSGIFEMDATNGHVSINTQLPVTYTTNTSSKKAGNINNSPDSTVTFSASSVNGNVDTDFS